MGLQLGSSLGHVVGDELGWLLGLSVGMPVVPVVRVDVGFVVLSVG